MYSGEFVFEETFVETYCYDSRQVQGLSDFDENIARTSRTKVQIEPKERNKKRNMRFFLFEFSKSFLFICFFFFFRQSV